MKIAKSPRQSQGGRRCAGSASYAQEELTAQAAHWVARRSDREDAARAVCGQLLRELWDSLAGGGRRWMPRPPGCPTVSSVTVRGSIRSAAQDLNRLSLIEASYRIGLLYTDLLPASVRAGRGAYYTPPLLAERLLDLAAGHGVDWSSVTALDPACGGGAFLVPAAMRMLQHRSLRRRGPEAQLAHLEAYLAGIEIDPFAAWMTRVFLQLLVLEQSAAAQRPLHVPVRTGDALELVACDRRRFDLVVGNPPFGRVSLEPNQRERFRRSLFGHANLYGVFLDAALRWRRPSGLVAFLTPTSFLGGRYYCRLRSLFLAEAPPLVIDVVSDRSGVFPSVQQETCLAVFGPNPANTTTVDWVEPREDGLGVARAGSFPLPVPGRRNDPWFLPKSWPQAAMAERAARMRTRLERLGYRASTGPLVWNRVKKQLRAEPGPGTYPLIWAEAVRPNAFRFDYRMRVQRSFVRVEDGLSHLLIKRSCVLVQRTTAKEQRRRLVACAVPEEFLAEWGAIVVENHVNVLWVCDPGSVSPVALAAVLNTLAVDEVFRCLSGSVAVSATELHALPLPPRSVFDEVEEILLARPAPDGKDDVIEALVAEAYGVTWSPLVA